MNFGYSEEQEMLRQGARDLLARECPMPFVRRMMEDEIGFSGELWRTMAELGWLGLVIPETCGGSGLDMTDLAVLLEEMGRAVLPGPFFSTVLLGGGAILECGNEEQQKRWLTPLAEGRLKATLAVLEASGRFEPGAIEATAAVDGAGYRLAGSKLFVPDAHVADLLLVVARTGKKPEEVTLFAIEVPSRSVKVTPLSTIDGTRRLCEVTLDQVRAGAEDVVGSVNGAWPVVERVIQRAKVGLAAEMCGGAERVLEICVDYAKLRTQFDRPIGSFQAVQHKCANMLLQIEAAKAGTAYAAWAIANEPERSPLAAAMAKAYASDAYRNVAFDGIQIHGGIGFTWEHDMHIYFRRAKASELAFGDGTANRREVARYAEL